MERCCSFLFLHIISGLKPQAMNNHRPPSIIFIIPPICYKSEAKKESHKNLENQKNS